MEYDGTGLAEANTADEAGSALSPLEKFLFDWDRIVGNIAFGKIAAGNWRKAAFDHAAGEALTVESARALAAKLSDPSKKLRPYEVFLLSFWNLVNTLDQRYAALLNEKEDRFYRDAMRFSTSQPEPKGEEAAPLAVASSHEDAPAFRIRTRQRFLNGDDLRKGFAYAFPENRIRLMASEREGDPRAGSALTIWVLRKEPDVHGEYTLSERDRRNVDAFLRETTSVHTNTQTIFDANWTDCRVRFDWREGADQGRGEKAIRRAFTEWAWSLWRFDPWSEAALKEAVYNFMSGRPEIRNIRVILGANAVHNGLLKLSEFSELAKGE
ncbi:hypothetical protein [Robbsia sp. KACC 23696]|uniref:hypothetical protein n=1 Tax=Robbsia sp. KACC 23696 TaxID=3149231 RepID=UPI00325AEB69